MKHEWRKKEKDLYLPKAKPTLITIPKLTYFSISGEGNPNSAAFGQAVGALYAVSYSVKTSPKKGLQPDGYFDYTVYPLEGFWSLNERGITAYQTGQTFDKEDLTFKVMIRQPDFMTEQFAEETIQRVTESKPNPYNERIQFESIEEGLCLQMLHIGPYDTEHETFQKMAAYCDENKLKRLSPTHKEIYLSDPRKSAPEKNKTVLRFPVAYTDD